MEWTYSERDVIAYALGLGCHRRETEFVYENDDSFSPLPTFPVLALHHGALSSIDIADFVHDFNPMFLLHGEQSLEVYKTIPTAGTLKITSRVVSVQSKGKASLVVIGVTLKEKGSSDTLAYAEASIFLRGATPKKSITRPPTQLLGMTNRYGVPDREPDAVMEEKTSPDLAAIYRLSGDWNPLHIDNEFAGVAGFSQPILHGLCTYGIAVKHAMKVFGGSVPSQLKSMQARFVKHVFPGETIQTEMWKVAEDTIVLRAKVKERSAVVLSNAGVKFVKPLTQSRL